MNEPRLTLRELRILRETERALCEDAELAARFREFGEPVDEPPGPAPGTRHRLWLLAGVCVLLVPVLVVLHPGAGALLLLSAVAVGAVGWAGHRGGRPGHR
ncbi:MAG TPA: DUF3040 domain-containing protein [Streptomyces sp.]|uniref:DUF3040 domain-containing protein n=1 Tax=Streptomyces sp. TaxID=1931 RepID=UPI002D55AD8B|nr:DUF3040 domain-containing protein [Streptomyces sp.]HZG07053.1 DUF3040 domain-containing protein [Streptomyces sp.]